MLLSALEDGFDPCLVVGCLVPRANPCRCTVNDNVHLLQEVVQRAGNLYTGCLHVGQLLWDRNIDRIPLVLPHLHSIIRSNIRDSNEFHVVLFGYGFGDAFADDAEPVNANPNLFTGHNPLGPYPTLDGCLCWLIAMTSLSIRLDGTTG